MVYINNIRCHKVTPFYKIIITVFSNFKYKNDTIYKF